MSGRTIENVCCWAVTADDSIAKNVRNGARKLPSGVVEVEANSVEEWTILNFTHEVHNFHIHQLHFRVLDSDDKFLDGRLLDTINVPIDPGTGSPPNAQHQDNPEHHH